MENYNTTYATFLQLVRLGIGTSKDAEIPKEVDWVALKALADRQGLSAVVLDGLNTDGANLTDTMPLQMKLEWIGEVLQGEQVYKLQHEVAKDMSNLFHNNAIRTYVLKGDVIAECYPKPEHRVSVDLDCFLVEETSSKIHVSGSKGFDAWSLGNDLIRSKHFDVKTDFYKNSTFDISGVVVENHQYMVPFRGNERLEKLERFFQEQFKEFNSLSSLRDQEFENSRIGDTWLYRPPVMVSALFLIEHAYSHFLHEGLTWRMVLDWVLFRKKHKDEIHWGDFEALIDEYGFRMFYDVFSEIGQEVFNDSSRILETFGTSDQGRARELENPTSKGSKVAKLKGMMLNDIWAPLDVHETVRGWRGKLALAGNTWRARWKYRYFTDMNWMKALWIQAKGVLFEKHPTLDS